jgi:tubulin epsilon
LQLFSDAFSRDSQLLVADPTQHTHLAAALMMRGRLSLSDAQRNIGRLRPQLRMAHWNTEVCVGLLHQNARMGSSVRFGFQSQEV